VLLGPGAEARSQQRSYTVAAADAFAPRNAAGEPHVVLAEAGTGIGKTLGYLAPASVWAEKNEGAVWISTYTRNLQRQIDHELDRLVPDAAQKRTRVVVRKGRENYVCLLNLDEEAARAPLTGGAVGVGLVARWALATRDGDMNGDFPSWLVGLAGYENTLGLTDRRGECIYSACRHYRRCAIERAQRRARHADLVIANHALVLANAARAEDGRDFPTRYVFDEGHQVFDAADAAFSAHLTGAEAADLRRWIRGSEGGRARRARGIEARVGDLAAGDPTAEKALDAAVRAASALPGPGWLGRLREPAPPSTQPAAEAFLARVRDHVLASQSRPDIGYSVEATTAEPSESLRDAAAALSAALGALSQPLQALARALMVHLDDDMADLDTESRHRIEAVCRGLARRAAAVDTWRAMAAAVEEGTPKEFVDRFSVERSSGREIDAGMHRHYVDPTLPFAETLLTNAHGALITSASLRDHAPSEDDDGGDNESWVAAEVRTGAHHLALPARRVSLTSPFDYAAQTRVFLVRDVRRDDVNAVSAAYRDLFAASGGGGLGLFTAISRLRAVHRHIAAPLDDAGLTLLAQHVDAMDTATLVDVFRADIHACLLGTDAVRDGVDVPGESLRLIVFDRVPWPRPDLLHRARKQTFGGARYDDLIARLRLRQAFGRLVRKAGDRGVFVLLDAMVPSRLLSAFPAGVAPERVGIKDAIARTAEFLAASTAGNPVAAAKPVP
jgi:ATP-dependent DNA helicase DinG